VQPIRTASELTVRIVIQSPVRIALYQKLAHSAEGRKDELTREIGSLEFQDKNSFKAPPKEWIDHRLATLRETLTKDTVSSSLALKELFGEIRLEPVTEKELTPEDILKGDSQSENNTLGQSPFKPFKPYYIAHTKIQTLALLDEEHKGSNWYNWRRGRDKTPFPNKTRLLPPVLPPIMLFCTLFIVSL
jgi:hypothetical protein